MTANQGFVISSRGMPRHPDLRAKREKPCELAIRATVARGGRGADGGDANLTRKLRAGSIRWGYSTSVRGFRRFERAAMRRFDVFPAGWASRHECAICFGSHELDPAPILWPPRQRRAPNRLAPRHNVANMRASGSLHEPEFACDAEP